MPMAAKVLRIVGTLLGLKGALFLLLSAWGAVAIPQTLFIGLAGTWLVGAAMLFWAAQRVGRIGRGEQPATATQRQPAAGNLQRETP
jgi:hypothetical protein